ncbi:MAG: ABC transporter permease [Synergistaceae bacterium]|jgi:inositol transport system permease protein|nr:ABC transporter permease [Synergistaceae bacterium]
MAQENKIDWLQILKKYGNIVVLVIMVAGISIIKPQFRTHTNIFNVLTQSCIFGIMALGMTFVIVSKGIDLSVGSVLALSGVIAASLAQMPEAADKYFPNLPVLHAIFPVLAALAVSSLCGAINGALIAFTGIPAFIATLGMYTVARGLALIYTSGRPISTLSPGFTFFGDKIFDNIPVPVLVYAAMIIVTWILLNKTRFGKSVYAIGGNIKAAEVSGIRIKKNFVKIYAYCSLMAGVAAIVLAGRVQSVHPGAATGYELTAIAATTIGGTSHSGGIGTVWGAVVGALILGVLRNGLTLLGIHPYWQQVCEGCIIVVAVIIDMKTHTQKK